MFGLLCCISGWGQGILIPAPRRAVQGAPFTLTVETRWERASGMGPKEGTQRIVRDSAGRQRYEASLVDGLAGYPLVHVYDVVAGREIELNSDTKTAEVRTMRMGPPLRLDVSVANTHPPENVAADQTLLGTKTIAGLEAWGQRTLRTATRIDSSAVSQDRELWISTHYQMPLMQVTRSEQGKTTQTVVSFDAAEPDPALFAIPPGFTVHDAPAIDQPAGGTFRVGGDVSAPVVLKTAEPEFSEEARRKKIKGNVLISLIVDERGLPQSVRVKRGIGQGLDEKAVEAVKQYRFRPATREGQPVKVEMLIEVNFQIF